MAKKKYLLLWMAIMLMLLSIHPVPAHSRSANSAHKMVVKPFDSLSFAPPWFKLAPPAELPSVPEQVVSHGSRKSKKVALTFDACSTSKRSQYDERVVKILIETGTKATMFLGGKWMEEEPEQTRFLASVPLFELGNHTFLHPHMTQISSDRMGAELRWTQEVLYALTGREAHLFRPPFGEYNSSVVHTAAAMGLTTVEYDLPSGDPDVHATKDKLVEYVTTMARNGSIIVMHMNGHGWHTAEALPEIISGLKKRGLTFVTVSELMQTLPKP